MAPLALTQEPAEVEPSITDTQIALGKKLFEKNCAVCHGATALGFVEAKEAFPEEDRRCYRCHRATTRYIDWLNIQDNYMFAIGDPPALRGERNLKKFGNGLNLFSYTKSTMPRYEPMRLNDSEYWAVIAYLLNLNDFDLNDILGDDALGEENAQSIILSSP
ncbi:MAG: cytochrome c [Deinococcales bacterium]